MPYYRITITDIHGKVSQGIRQDAITDIDVYYGKARQKAIISLRNSFQNIEVIMLVSTSEEVNKHLEKLREKTSVTWAGPASNTT